MNERKEGDLYKTLHVAGTTFENRYRDHSANERPRWGETPIYPDILREPQYTAAGLPYATAWQDVCEHYHPRTRVSGENWCNDCKFFAAGEPLIGVCQCNERRCEI